MHVGNEPIADGQKVSVAHHQTDVGKFARNPLEILRRMERSHRISREISKRTVRPMDVLQDAFALVFEFDTEEVPVFFVP